MSTYEPRAMGLGEASMLNRIVGAASGHRVESGAQWLALSKSVPGVSYFATDVDPRSFEKDETQDTWLGRAELLLKAPAELRPGQAMQDVSFTLPVKVVLSGQGGELTVTVFDFYSAVESAAPALPFDPDDGPPKSIGWGPFENLI